MKEIPSSTELLSIAFKLEDLKLGLDRLAKKTNDIAEYYKSVGSSEEKRFRRVSDMFSSAKGKVDDIKTRLRDNVDNINMDRLLEIKQDIKYLKDIVLKDILYVMLSSDDDIEHIKSGSVKDCNADDSCFDRAVRICQPVTFRPDGMLVELRGLEGRVCMMRVSAGQDEMTCKLEKYTLGVSDPEADLFPYCTGNLLQILRSREAGSTAVQEGGQ